MEVIEEQEEAEAKEKKLEDQITAMVMDEESSIRSRDPLATAELHDADDSVPFPEIPMTLAEQKEYE